MKHFSELGQIVANARHEQGITQDELASSSGVSRSTITLIENGSFGDLGVRKIIRVCVVLGLELGVGKININEDYAAEELQAANEADQRIAQTRRISTTTP